LLIIDIQPGTDPGAGLAISFSSARNGGYSPERWLSFILGR
jgi:hypothetical protein